MHHNGVLAYHEALCLIAQNGYAAQPESGVVHTTSEYVSATFQSS